MVAYYHLILGIQWRVRDRVCEAPRKQGAPAWFLPPRVVIFQHQQPQCHCSGSQSSAAFSLTDELHPARLGEGWWSNFFSLEELMHWKGQLWFKRYTGYQHPRTASSAWRITGMEARLALQQLEFWSTSGLWNTSATSPVRLSSQTWACFSAPHLWLPSVYTGKVAMKTKLVMKRHKKIQAQRWRH